MKASDDVPSLPSIDAVGLLRGYGEGAIHTPVLRDLSLRFNSGQLSLVMGASGSGKSTLLAVIGGLLRPQAGQVSVLGTPIWSLSPAALERFRFRNFGYVFQGFNLFAALTAVEQVMQPLLFADVPRAQAQARAEVVLDEVGLAAQMRLRPAQLSGGEKQRVAIARALVTRPAILLADEPTSALDVSVQAQILNLLKDLQKTLGVSYLFITHNIGVVEYLAHDVSVMYLGRIVETGTAEEVLRRPRHPYTQALLAAVPRVETGRKLPPLTNEVKERLAADVPSPANPPAGCHFHTRCPLVVDACKVAYPAEVAVSSTHKVRCIMVKPEQI